jgi:serine/threonine protein kinase
MNDTGAWGWLRRVWGGRTPARTSLEIGDLLCGRYRLTARLGMGASSTVYRAHDELLGADVAVKVLRTGGPGEGSTGLDVDLREEAKASLALAHPHIVRTWTYERDGGIELIVMELIQGQDLGTWRRRFPERRVPRGLALQIARQCADALAYAHDRGVLHNDIKPGNILVDDAAFARVCDFGLARSLRAEDSQGSQDTAGTIPYMSPERLRREQGDGRSDVYSLGATLYAALTGRPPFGGSTYAAIRGHLECDPPPHEAIAPDLAAVIGRAMAKRPADRYASAHELRDALDRCVGVPSDPPLGFLAVATEDLTPTESSSEPLAPELRRPARAPEGMSVVGPRQVDLRGRTLLVPRLFVDRHPVTHRAWRRYVLETGARAPSHWLGDRVPAGREEHPVVGVTLEEARRYAAWRGARLLTEVEWIGVLRGEDGRLFPWGDHCEPERCQCPRIGANDTAAVGSHPGGATADGVEDLLGTVWEWVDPDPRLPSSGLGIALGGSFRHACAIAGVVPRTEIEVNKSYLYLGFRCAMDAA